MTAFYLAPLVFFVVSFVFSMLGMGGSQLYIPILFWLGLDFKTEAVPLGMLLNVVSSSSAAVTYTLRGLVDWKTALPFGGVMVLMAPVGAWVNVSLPTEPIIVVFALFTAAAGLLMLSGWKPESGGPLRGHRLLLGFAAGAILGFLAGLIGRGGGSFVVPLLYIAGLPAKAAAATSSFVVTCSGLASFFSHILTAARPNTLLWSMCAAAVLAGSQLGSRFMSTRLKAGSVRLVFGIILIAVAAALLVKDVF